MRRVDLLLASQNPGKLHEMRHLAAGIAGARLVVYPGVGHIPEVEIAERFNSDLLEFLAPG